MKSENGVTLIALITIIIILTIIMSVGIYSGINSYKVIAFEKYKAQMQLIQNAVDELYEENKNNDIIGNNKKYYGKKIVYYDENNEKKINSDVTDFWNEEIAKGEFGIALEDEEYYCVSAKEIENVFDLEKIDISQYYVINFEKRYVFSVTPIKVINGDDNTEKYIYCLYQLDEEEKIVEFKIESNGEFEYDCIPHIRNLRFVVHPRHHLPFLQGQCRLYGNLVGGIYQLATICADDCQRNEESCRPRYGYHSRTYGLCRR